MAFEYLNFILDYIYVTTIIIFIISFLVVWLWFTTPSCVIPGPTSIPLFGNLLSILRIPQGEHHQYFKRLADEYGDIYRLYMGRKLCVVLNNYELVNEVYIRQGDISSDRPQFLPTSPGNGVVWTNRTTWKTLRRFCLQAMRDFGMGKKSIEDTVQEEVSALFEDLKKTKGGPVRIKQFLMTSVSNVIHSICFGFRYSHDDKHFQNIVAFWEKVFREIEVFVPNPIRVLVSFIQNKLYKNIIRKHVDDQILEHQKTFDKDHVRDFIDLYIKINQENTEDKVIFTHANLYRSIIDLFAAGTDTTATTLDWALMFMIAYPGMQDKCRKEIEDVVGNGRRVHMADKSKLPFTEAVILEVLRYSSILPLGVPHMLAKDIKINGYAVPKGTMLLSNQQAIHFNKSYWDEPAKFNPERFLDADGNIKKTDELIPFSVGPRICLGESLARMELFLFFANLIQRFTFTKAEEDDILDFNGVLGVTLGTKPYKLRVKVN